MAMTTSCLKELNSTNLHPVVKKNSTWLETPLPLAYLNNICLKSVKKCLSPFLNFARQNKTRAFWLETPLPFIYLTTYDRESFCWVRTWNFLHEILFLCRIQNFSKLLEALQYKTALRRLRSDLLNPKVGSRKSALFLLKSRNFLET